LAILVGSAAVLSQLIDKGRRHAMRAMDVTEAQTVANNVMSEILVGLRAWQSTTAERVDPFQPWDVSVQIEPTEIDELSAVTVAVFQRPPPGAMPVQRDEAERRAYRLVRWVRRPVDSSEVSDATP
jgi:hypothetical protein